MNASRFGKPTRFWANFIASWPKNRLPSVIHRCSCSDQSLLVTPLHRACGTQPKETQWLKVLFQNLP